jgi:hypothetical protein
LISLDFTPGGEVSRRFMLSPARVRLIRGPVASGKSVTCCLELMRIAIGQAPNMQGVRKTRFAIVRNTNPELRTTTIKTWNDWFGEDYGKFRWQPPYTHNISFQLPDKTMVESEVIFLALDRPQDIKKLLSLELTAGWVNEAREVSKSIVDALDMRLGRYPSERDGGCTRACLILDTNSPPEDHWWAIMSGEVPPPEYMTSEEVQMMVKPDNWEFFTQPAAMLEDIKNKKLLGFKMNPERENRSGIKDAYYQGMIPGKTRAFINVYILNKYQSLFDGKPVYPTFRRDTHVAPQPLLWSENSDIIVGIDYGRTPSAVFAQLLAGGRWAVLHELLAVNMGAKRFAELLKREIARKGWSHANFRFYGDPAGDDLTQSDETSPSMMLRAQGIPVVKAPSNDPSVRIEAVEQVLDRMTDGGPAIVISPSCKNLIAGFEGGYRYARLGTSGDHYDVKPDKNRFSHPHDAFQYAVMGGGEGRRVLSARTEPSRATVVPRNGNPLTRMRSRAGGSRFAMR